MTSRKSFQGKEIISSLTKKGFEEGNNHHKMLYLCVDGKRTAVRTKVSHGRKLYEGNLWSALRRQLCLHNEGDSCERLIGCTLGAEEYLEILRNNNSI
jgi:hypothetical protein